MECAFRELEEETGYRVESPENLEYLMSLTTTVAFCDEAIDIRGPQPDSLPSESGRG